ncbi:hypothetical protein EDC96DRAFT_439612 [Choanephora cucurbitarum]|nr:hypothetical protein EDC96DRAFT_439612 [Choanephora cucurbitarum]
MDCYKVLQLDKQTATLADIKKSYRKLALKFHPDKQPADATEEQKTQANTSFQQLGKAYAVLSDPKRKERYDKTGSMDESQFDDDQKDWTAYFKELWSGVVSEETIEAQKLKYQGSQEEQQDVIKAYKELKGDMNKILSVIECSTAADCVRFEKIIRQAIEEKQVPFFKKLDTTTTAKAQKARLDREAKDEQEFDEEKAQSSSSLAALIQQRNQQRQSKMNSIIDSIETSAKGKKRKGPEKDIALPSDEEFMKLQEKLFKKKK